MTTKLSRCDRPETLAEVTRQRDALLAACRAALDWMIDVHAGGGVQIESQLRAAIADATGEKT